MSDHLMSRERHQQILREAEDSFRVRIRAIVATAVAEAEARFEVKMQKALSEQEQTLTVRFTKDLKQGILTPLPTEFNKECPICLCQHSDCQTPCNHYFHMHCLDRWLQSDCDLRYHCPLCRHWLARQCS